MISLLVHAALGGFAMALYLAAQERQVRSQARTAASHEANPRRPVLES